MEGDEFVPSGAILRILGNDGGVVTELPLSLRGRLSKLVTCLLKDCRGGGAGSRIRGAAIFECFTSSSSLMLSKFRNFSFSTKKDLVAE